MATTVFLHCGLHKTGTSAIQQAFAQHRDRLAAHGVLYPATAPGEVGHHDIAWRLAGDRRFDAAAGAGIEDTLLRIAAFDGDAVLSSEDFETVLDRPAAFAPLLDRLGRAGRQVRLVIYLREPGRYAESLYVELLRHGYAAPMRRFLRSVRAEGRLRYRDWVFQFDYGRLRRALAGTPCVWRDYEMAARTGSVVCDFLQVIGQPPDLLGEAALHRANPRADAADALSLFYANRVGRQPDAAEAAVIERICRARPAPAGRLCTTASVLAIQAIARLPAHWPGWPAQAAARLLRWG